MTDTSKREELIRAVQAVTWNASNYPTKIQPHVLGQDIEPLTMKIVDAVEAVFEQAHTPTAPTDDEQEARDQAWIDWDAAQYTAPAAFGGKRLSNATLGDAFYAGWDARARHTAQGEPTDAQVIAALDAYWGVMNADPYGSRDAMRDALRAAADAGQEEKR